LSHLANSRQEQQSRGRRALGLFAAVWLNLALQPCAMAFAAEDHNDCLHCPPVQSLEHDGVHGDMGHDIPCADGLSDCALVDALSHDGRSGKIKLNDTPVDTLLAIAPHELAVPFRQPANTTLHPRYTSVHAGAAPPLHVLHCVYLK